MLTRKGGPTVLGKKSNVKNTAPATGNGDTRDHEDGCVSPRKREGRPRKASCVTGERQTFGIVVGEVETLAFFKNGTLWRTHRPEGRLCVSAVQGRKAEESVVLREGETSASWLGKRKLSHNFVVPRVRDTFGSCLERWKRSQFFFIFGQWWRAHRPERRVCVCLCRRGKRRESVVIHG